MSTPLDPPAAKAQAAATSQDATISQNATDSAAALLCLNCGAESSGRYCPECGQRKGEVRVSLRRLMADVLEDQLSINSTLPRTLAALFLHPGRLTAEYVSGRIASYVAPFRLYLVASLVFFLTLSFGNRVTFNSGEIDEAVANASSADSATAAARADTMAGRAAASDSGSLRMRTSRDMRFGIFIDTAGMGADPSAHWTDALLVNTGSPRLDSLIAQRVRRLGRMPVEEFLTELWSELLLRLPTAMFLLLPVFALMLKVLYLRSRRYYVEHFIFALHYHAFAFLLFTVMVPLDNTFIAPLLMLWLLLYMPLALKRVYRQGWFVTLFKWGVLGTAYSVVLAVALFVTLIAAGLFM